MPAVAAADAAETTAGLTGSPRGPEVPKRTSPPCPPMAARASPLASTFAFASSRHLTMGLRPSFAATMRGVSPSSPCQSCARGAGGMGVVGARSQDARVERAGHGALGRSGR